MRLLVCGSREWPGSWEDIAIHFPEPGDHEDVTIIHGACSRVRGGVEVSVDSIADWIARGLGFYVEPYPVDRAKDGPWPGAGPRRNTRMLAEGKPNRGLAFGALYKQASYGQGYTGTGGMVNKMLAAGLPVRWVATPTSAALNLPAMPVPP